MIVLLQFWAIFVRTLIRFDNICSRFISHQVSFTSHFSLVAMKRSFDLVDAINDDAPICAICRTATTADDDKSSCFSLCNHAKHKVHHDCGKLFWLNRLMTAPRTAVQCPVCMRANSPECALDVFLSLVESKDLTLANVERWHDFFFFAANNKMSRTVEQLRPVLDLVHSSPMAARFDQLIMMECMLITRDEIPWDILEAFASQATSLPFETLIQSNNMIVMSNLLKFSELLPNRVWDFVVCRLVEPILRMFVESPDGFSYFNVLHKCILQHIDGNCINATVICDLNAWFNMTILNATRHTDAIDDAELDLLLSLVDNFHGFGLRIRLDCRELARSYQKFVLNYVSNFEAFEVLVNEDNKFRRGVFFWNAVLSKVVTSFTPALFTSAPELTWDRYVYDYIVANLVPLKIRASHHDIVWVYAFVQNKTSPRLTATALRRFKGAVRDRMVDIIEFFHEEPLTNLVSLLCVIQDKPLIQQFCDELLRCFVSFDLEEIRYDHVYPILSNVVLLMRCSAKPAVRQSNRVAQECIKLLQKGVAPDRIQRAAYEFLLRVESSIEKPLPAEVKTVFADRWPEITAVQ